MRITSQGTAVVYWWKVALDGDKQDEKFWVFSSLEEAAKHPEVNTAVRQAIEKMGVPMEELDI